MGMFYDSCDSDVSATEPSVKVRKFDTGATRDIDTTKNDYEGFLSPLVIERFGEYMTKHRVQADGSLRESDNWQKGIPLPAYMKSAWRHFLQWWKLHRGYQIYPMGWSKWPDGETREPEDIEEVLCAMIFNAQGYLHEVLKKKAAK